MSDETHWRFAAIHERIDSLESKFKLLAWAVIVGGLAVALLAASALRLAVAG